MSESKKRIAYISPVFSEHNSYRENVLVEYLVKKSMLDIYTFARPNKHQSLRIRKCRGIRYKEFYFYFSMSFLFERYDYIILSDLRQISPVIFGLFKVFSKSKIIIEHEQRNIGKSYFGRVMTIILYLPFYLLYIRADIIRSPNIFSTAFLKYFYFDYKKIKELPLAVSTRFLNETPRSDVNSELKILWTGKRFYEKSGKMLLDYLNTNVDAKLTILTSDDISIKNSRVTVLPMQPTSSFIKIAKEHSICVYLSPTQSIFDTSALGLPTVIPKSFVPDFDSTKNKFIFLDCETTEDGVVEMTDRAMIALRVVLDNYMDYTVNSYRFSAENLWFEYE